MNGFDLRVRTAHVFIYQRSFDVRRKPEYLNRILLGAASGEDAQARHILVSLRQEPQKVTLEICDDGRGFDPGLSFPGHLGLISMRERVAKLGGNIEIKSQPGQGTVISVWLPLTIQY